MKYLPPLLIGIQDEDDADKIVVPALRELGCVLLLARFQVHTSDTLALLQQHIEGFGMWSEVRSRVGTSDLH